ncbi:MAG: Calx-beta domain-containing protein, partial [Luteolibacter sp.]
MDVYVSVGAVPGNLPPTLAISASNTNPTTSGSITLTATATDPNADPLAYSWVFNDGTYSTNNSPSQTKSWTTAGHYQVLCTASDMKGGRTTRSILITVGNPTTFTVTGNITGPDSQPLEGVYVANYAPSNLTSHPNSATFRGTWTDSEGNYTLTGLTAGSYTLSPNLYPNVFTPSSFTNPVAVGPSSTGKNFVSSLLPSLTINVTDPIANEGTSPGTGTIRLERTGSTDSALAVQIFNTNTGTATRTTDYALSPLPTAATSAQGGSGTSQYTIPAGAAFLDITVTPANDSTKEGTEYAALNFANTSGGYILAGPAVALVDIIDDESPNLPVVKLTHVDNVASEDGPDTAVMKIERNGATTNNLTVNFTSAGTAMNVIDYAMPTSVVIPAGSASTTFALTPVDDSTQEETETAIVTIANNAAYARDTLSNAQTITIHDNEQPSVTLVASDPTATEAAGNSGFFTITRTGGNPYQALTVDYALSGRAVHGVDYRRLDGRAVIPAGAFSTTVEIQPYDDAVDEGTQDVILQLRSTTAYRIGDTGIAVLNITDNENSQIYLKLTDSGKTEPATGSITAVAFQIVRPASGTAVTAVTVNYALSGTATNGVDFTALPGTIAFASGDTTKTINVSALADTELENAETVTLTLLSGTG